MLNDIDASISRDFDLVMSNDQDAYNELMNACARSILNDDAATNDMPDAYREAHRTQDDTWRTIVECARLELLDTFVSMVETETEDGMVRQLLLQVLDVHNAALWDDITEMFMPDPDDILDADD